MNEHKKIPCNIITGFLGVGKTTAILHLLSQKPAQEKWAVLVNEFGEVGIDGAILAGNSSEQSNGVTIREVPGGCMCCVAGVPMQVGLTQLIRQAKPDRLLIEPTGLGHPYEILNILQGEQYADILDVRALITLVDPRKLSDSRYRDHQIFTDQLSVADVLVANKIDACSGEHLADFEALLATSKSQYADRISNGELNAAWLDVAQSKPRGAEGSKHHHHGHSIETLALAPGETLLRRESEKNSAGFISCGWLLSPEKTFDYDKLFNWFCGLEATRVKAVLICEGAELGVFAFNSEDGVLKVMELDDCLDQRLEIIDTEKLDWGGIEKDWLSCLR